MMKTELKTDRTKDNSKFNADIILERLQSFEKEFGVKFIVVSRWSDQHAIYEVIDGIPRYVYGCRNLMEIRYALGAIYNLLSTRKNYQKSD